LAINFTNSFVKDALTSLLLSFTAIYCMLVGLLKYRDYLLSLLQNQ
jgi:hypothetical protein